MPTIKASQQHRLLVMQPKKVNRFPRQPWTAAADNEGHEARRTKILEGHTRVRNSVDDGEVEACWEYYSQHVGRTKARTWVENTWN